MNEKLFNPDYLKHLCEQYGLRPSSKYGQNFLINPEPVEAMIEVTGLSKNDTVIEVGPGFGVLTFALAEKVKKVIAFEIEKKIAPYWEKFKPENVEVVWGNILKISNSQFLISNYKIVANLPYQITSNFIRQFLEMENPPEEMVLMVQKEVAERICARAGEMSLLSVAVQYYADAEIVLDVPRSYFWPEPKVDSAIIKIKNKRLKIKNFDRDSFFNVVKIGFANRRKLLIKNLKSLQPDSGATLIQIFSDLNLLPTARAQELSVEQWKQLVEVLNK